LLPSYSLVLPSPSLQRVLSRVLAARRCSCVLRMFDTRVTSQPACCAGRVPHKWQTH
jgi:hypothetical protein